MKKKAADKCLIVCNGEINKRLLHNIFKLNSGSKEYFVIAADGAANLLFKLKLVPDIITGDFDSIEPKTLTYFKSKKVRIQKIFNQDRNDFEKALGFALSMQYGRIDVLGALGKRLDHTLNNLNILKKYSKLSDIRLYDNEFEISFIDESAEFTYPKGEVVSLMAFPKAEGIITKGLKYTLKNESLELGKREGALNSSNADTVKVELAKGDLLIFKKHLGKIS